MNKVKGIVMGYAVLSFAVLCGLGFLTFNLFLPDTIYAISAIVILSGYALVCRYLLEQ